ncbi:peptidylprolyl isomerase [Petrocella sp. FN5]|uniref:peptidylprolyl isomerase n=1 Tax=Petrocella sp. FN5 TaxID=3032002 RepID=UPI0023DCC7DB|nr:peptidylprolyl isomerase [Petrocella sp. FN5]MDF1616475.1 peptidylprolyl isomerase [Petrocella sp. FN5]
MVLVKKIIPSLVCLLIAITVVMGCSTSKTNPDTWLRIGNAEVEEAEVMVYLFQTYNDFLAFGGEDVWEIKDFSGGKSANEVAKQGALDNLIKVKVLNQKADEQGITLTESEVDILEQEAKRYYDSLSGSFIEKYEISLETVYDVIGDNYRARSLENQTIESYELDSGQVEDKVRENVEYVKLKDESAIDILTSYYVQHIVVYTHEKNSDDVWMALDVEKVIQARSKIEAAYEAVHSGVAFEEVLREYSEDPISAADDLGIMLSNFQLPKDFIVHLQEINPGEMTPIIEGEYGFHIFKLLFVETPDKETVGEYNAQFELWEKSLYEEARAKLYKEAFDNIYSRWLQGVSIELGPKWLELDLLNAVENE